MSSADSSSKPSSIAGTSENSGSSASPKPDDPEKGEKSSPANKGPRNCNPLVYFPILLAAYIPFLIISCFIQGYITGHFNFLLPLVSDTGNYVPEAGTFCFAIIMIGVLFFIVVIIRYLQIKAIILDPTFEQMVRHFFGTFALDALAAPAPKELQYPPVYRLKNVIGQRNKYNQANLFILSMGVFISFSCMATGAFRFAESFVWHNLSALGVFFLTPFYMAGNTYLSSVWCNAVNSVAIYRRRKQITAITFMLVFIFSITIVLLSTVFMKTYQNPVTRLFWNWKTTGFILHVVNSFTEWAFLLSISPFAYTFAEDFARLSFFGLRLKFEFFPMGPDGGDSPRSPGRGGPRGPGAGDDSDSDGDTPKKQRTGDAASDSSPAYRLLPGADLNTSNTSISPGGGNNSLASDTSNTSVARSSSNIAHARSESVTAVAK